MSKVNVVLQPHPDGTVHLPVPPELRNQPVKVKAELEALGNCKTRAHSGLWKTISGPFSIAADFDEPLEDFQEYMG